MFVIALTGGLGAGKTEAARVLERHGAVLLDLDEIAKGLLVAESDVHKALVAAFGEDILDQRGEIVRMRLAEAAFACDATTATLDAIVHPAVIDEVERRLQALALQARPPEVVVLEIPLLAEAPSLRDLVDLVVAIEAPEDVRLDRTIERGMDRADAERRVARQASDEDRRAVADVIIANDGETALLHERLDEIWREHVESRRGNDAS